MDEHEPVDVHRCQASVPLVISLMAVGGLVAIGTAAVVIGVIFQTPNRRRCRPTRRHL